MGYTTPTHSETPQYTWRNIRSGITDAGKDTALAATTKTWAARPTTKLFDIPTGFNNLELRFRANENDATATFAVYMYANEDDAVKVCTGTIEAGAMTATMGGFYAKTITPTSVWGTDIVEFNNLGATDDMARIAFDCIGYDYLLVELTTVTSGDDAISVDVRGF